MRNKIILLIVIINSLSFLYSCSYNYENRVKNEDNTQSTEKVYLSQFFESKIIDPDNKMMTEYGVYYNDCINPPVLIVNIGSSEHFEIINERIYFVDGNSLCSVKLNGSDKKELLTKGVSMDITDIVCCDSDWIYCNATRYGAVQNNGLCSCRIQIATNYDFSRWKEVK